MLKAVQIFAVVLLVIIIAASLYFLKSTGVSAVVGLPMLAVGAVALLLILMGGMSVLYASYNIHDKTQALALPEGSIRAVIALMLIVLFAVLSIYLFGSLSDGRVVELGTVSAAERASLESLYKADGVISVQLDEKGDKFRVWLKQGASDAGTDFAKQLLVLVGTLVTSISSFYFGAKASSPSNQSPETQERPAIEKLQPSSVQRGSGGVGFTATGRELQRIKTVKLVNGQRELEAVGLAVSPTQMNFTAVIPVGTDAGKWDLKLIDGGGNAYLQSAALEVT